jgi:CHAT domain-containing protein
LTGADASCATIRALAASGALTPFNIIVFATHACHHDGHPRLIDLALADGEISIDELAFWPLGAALVLMSACDGARAVVSARREVEDT